MQKCSRTSRQHRHSMAEGSDCGRRGKQSRKVGQILRRQLNFKPSIPGSSQQLYRPLIYPSTSCILEYTRRIFLKHIQISSWAFSRFTLRYCVSIAVINLLFCTPRNHDEAKGATPRSNRRVSVTPTHTRLKTSTNTFQERKTPGNPSPPTSQSTSPPPPTAPPSSPNANPGPSTGAPPPSAPWTVSP